MGSDYTTFLFASERVRFLVSSLLFVVYTRIFTSRLAPPIKHDDYEDGIGESASETRIQAIRDRAYAHTHAYE